MASISTTLTSHSGPLQPSDAFRSYAMSSFPPLPGLQPRHEERSRDSPTHSTNTLPRPVNLPPLSSIDPRQQRPSHSPSPAEPQNQSQPPVLPGHLPQYGTLLPSMTQYYGSQLNASGQYVGSSTPIAVASAASRFPIAPTSDPNSIISGGRHKKEVKKRTKTGCMTCRKRRIKVGYLEDLISSTPIPSLAGLRRWCRQTKSLIASFGCARDIIAINTHTVVLSRSFSLYSAKREFSVRIDGQDLSSSARDSCPILPEL